MGQFSVKVHHKGTFNHEKGFLQYLGGEEIVMDMEHRDKWGIMEVYDLLEKLGYLECNISLLLYKDCGVSLDKGLRKLKTDANTMDMAKIGVEKEIVDLFVVHKKSVADDFPYELGFIDVVVGNNEDICAEVETQNVEIEAHVSNDVGLEEVPIDEEEPHANVADSSTEEDKDDESEEDLDLYFNDSEDDFYGDNALFDINISLEEMHQESKKRKKSNRKSNKKKIVSDVQSYGLRDDKGINSDDLEDLSPDEDEKCRKFPVYKELKDMSAYEWKVGTLFATRDEFKDAVITYAVHSGKNINFPVVDNVRVKAKCEDGCEWFVYAVKMVSEDSWQLRNAKNNHSCNSVFDIRGMKAKWLAKVFRRKFEENPRLKLKDIQEWVQTKWNVELPNAKASRVKQIALFYINHNYEEQYKRLYDYCHELLRANPGSSVKLQVQLPLEAQIETPTVSKVLRPKFERIYVCLDACKKSFMVCRPMIALDGYFLKTPYGGWLLCAIGWDPNDQMLPIAYGVVEAETKDSWKWFLSLLSDDLGHDKITRCTFMSDQQKGLVSTFDELFPGVDHRFCVKHLYTNFCKKFPGLNLKSKILYAAKCTYLKGWEKEVMEIRQINREAYKHLIGINPKLWCKSRFSFYPKCDTLVNNMCDDFNNAIVGSRDKPIITMLEDIRVYLMKRWAEKKENIEKYTDDILPRIKLRLRKEINAAHWWFPVAAGIGRYEVSRGREKFVVDLVKHQCSCRKFQLIGLPCAHAVSAINHSKDDIKKYVDSCYKRDTYVACYQHVIGPCNGEQLWERTEYEDVLPPSYQKPIKLSNQNMYKVTKKQRCSECGVFGHNKRRCPQILSNGTSNVSSPIQNTNMVSKVTPSQNSNVTSQVSKNAKATRANKEKNTKATNNTEIGKAKKYEDVLPLPYHKSIGSSTKKRNQTVDEEPSNQNMFKVTKKQRCSECDEFGHNKRSCLQTLSCETSNVSSLIQNTDVVSQVTLSQNTIATTQVAKKAKTTKVNKVKNIKVTNTEICKANKVKNTRATSSGHSRPIKIEKNTRVANNPNRG